MFGLIAQRYLNDLIEVKLVMGRKIGMALIGVVVRGHTRTVEYGLVGELLQAGTRQRVGARKYQRKPASKR